MKPNKRLSVDLRGLILASSLLILFSTLIISFYAAFWAQRKALLDNAYEVSRAYAEKMASTVGDFLYGAQRRLAFSAGQIGGGFDDNRLLASEAQRLLNQDASFSSIVITDTHGRVMEAQPNSSSVDELIESSLEIKAALAERRPMIGNVHRTQSGNLLIFISVPVRNNKGDFLGLIGGAIHIHEHGTLHTLLRDHYNRDGTYTYIVDRQRWFIDHPDVRMAGQLASRNEAVDAVLKGQIGNQIVASPLGQQMIAGFAPVPSAGWGVVSQRSRDSTLAALDSLMTQMLLSVLPFAILSIIAIWWLAHLISLPLRQLAQSAIGIDSAENILKIKNVRAWYQEAAYIKQKMLKGMGSIREKFLRLNSQARTDPLTGLANRRAKREAMRKLEAEQQPFSIIVLDIDHFKSINDSFGHTAGDAALSALAALLKKCSRNGDLACRVGGEEFLLLLPSAPIDAAARMGERLRLLVEQMEIETVGHLTISLGVAAWPTSGQTVDEVMKKADELMYRAKTQGRNRMIADV